MKKATHLGPLLRPATEIQFRPAHSASARPGPTSVVRVGPALAHAGSGHTVGFVGLNFCPIFQVIIRTFGISGQMTQEKVEIVWYMSRMLPLRPSVLSAAFLWCPGGLGSSGNLCTSTSLVLLYQIFPLQSPAEPPKPLNECHGVHVSTPHCVA